MSSSLQRRVRDCAAAIPPKGKDGNAPDPSSVKSSFESCFSSGMDLSEMSTSCNLTTGLSMCVGGAVHPSAAAELLRFKAASAERVTREDREEAMFEQRVSEVASRKTAAAATAIDASEDILSLPRVTHPQSAGTAVGGSRENNYLKVGHGDAGSGCEFLSSLVGIHKFDNHGLNRERRKGANGSLKSRTVVLDREKSGGSALRNQMVVSKSAKRSKVSTRNNAAQTRNKKVATKKTKRSKY